jgi:hypothetical protein
VANLHGCVCGECGVLGWGGLGGAGCSFGRLIGGYDGEFVGEVIRGFLEAPPEGVPKSSVNLFLASCVWISLARLLDDTLELG